MTSDAETAGYRGDDIGSEQAVRLVLMPPVLERDIVSMNRFSTELVSELLKHEELTVNVAPGTLDYSLPRWVPRRIRRGSTRFLLYPMAVRRLTGDIFHLLTHAYGHLTTVLPAERMVVTCHDVIPLRAQAMKAPFAVPRATLAWYRLAVSFLRRVAHVACVSEATRRDVIQLVGVDPSRTSVVLQGLSERFRPLSAERRGLVRSSFPTDAKLVLHVSSGAAYKNVEGTLRVLAHLRQRGQKVLLLRVGPRLRPEQRTVADHHGVCRYLIEVGSPSDERLAELYGAVDAVIFPSYWEGFGLPAAEALACGAPTVVSDCEPLLETVGDAALAAPATDSQALAGAVCRLWESPSLRAELRERGLARVRRFSWELAGDQYVKLYRRIRREAQGPPTAPREMLGVTQSGS